MPLWLLIRLFSITTSCLFPSTLTLRLSSPLLRSHNMTSNMTRRGTATSSDNNSTMRAMVYGREYVEEALLPVPTLNNVKNHVLVRVVCAGLNPVDAKNVLGDKLPHSWKRTRAFVKRNFVDRHVIGFDWSGIVVESSNTATDYKAGDEVYGTMPPLKGSLAEYIVAPLDQLGIKPKRLSFAEAAALPLVGLTALQSLQPCMRPGNSILVLGGSGGTGHVALSVARALGATKVCAVCSARNFDFVRRQGATHVIDYHRDDLIRKLRLFCDDELDGRPFDVVFDSVTSADPKDSRNDYPKQLLEAKLVSNKYIRLGGETLDWFRAGCERVLPVSCFGLEKLFWIRFPKSSDELRQLQEWADQEKLKPHVSRVVHFGADQVQGAFEMILDRRVKGKLVVRINREE